MLTFILAERGSLTYQQNNIVEPTRYSTIINKRFPLSSVVPHALPCIESSLLPYSEEPPPPMAGGTACPMFVIAACPIFSWGHPRGFPGFHPREILGDSPT